MRSGAFRPRSHGRSLTWRERKVREAHARSAIKSNWLCCLLQGSRGRRGPDSLACRAPVKLLGSRRQSGPPKLCRFPSVPMLFRLDPSAPLMFVLTAALSYWRKRVCYWTCTGGPEGESASCSLVTRSEGPRLSRFRGASCGEEGRGPSSARSAQLAGAPQ